MTIPEEVDVGDKVRLVVSSDGTGYAYGTVADFDGEDALISIDDDYGSEVVAPYWDFIQVDELPDDSDSRLINGLVAWKYNREEKLNGRSNFCN